MLQENSRRSFTEIAVNLGKAFRTVCNRVKKLEARGIIKGYTAIVDPNKLDLSLTALILIQAEGRYLLDVEEELAKLDGIISIYEIAGVCNIAAIARFKEEAMLDNFIENILKLPHRGKPKIVIKVVRNVIKEDCSGKI